VRAFIFESWLLTSVFLGAVLSLAAMFIVSGVFPDKYAGEGAEALYVIPKFILPASIFIGFVLGFYKADKYDEETNS
jgi:hypothetical protein